MLITNMVVCCLPGMIKLVSKHRAQLIYTRNTKGGDEEVAAAAEKAEKGDKGDKAEKGEKAEKA